MGVFDPGSIDNPKPSRPMAPGRQRISLRIAAAEDQNLALNFNKNTNFALEVLKYMPKWELEKYAGDANSNFSLNQYADTIEDEDGNILPAFGEVVRSKRGSTIDGTGMGKYINNIDFYDAAGDFDHIDDTINNAGDILLVEDITPELWNKAISSLEGQEGNYYDIMMQGISGYSSEDAYHLMVAMLESRERASSAYTNIFGSADLSAEERSNVLNQFIEQYRDKIDNKKMGTLSFLLNIQQSFYSRIMPMYGGSDQFYTSDLDKSRVNEFNETLSEKLAEYIGIADFESLTDAEIDALDEDKQTALLLWDKWVNPENMIEPAQNLDPKDEEWGEAAYDATDEFFNLVVQDNLIRRIIFRGQYDKYKEDMEEYEEKEDENLLEKISEARRTSRRKSEMKRDENKMIARNRAANRPAKVRAGSAASSKKSNYSSSKFKKTLNRIAGRVRASSGKSASSVISKVTPAQTAKFSSKSRSKSSSKVAPTGKVIKTATASSRSITSSKKRIKKSTAKIVAKNRASAKRVPSKSKARGTSSVKRTALSRALTQRNIKTKAPKQKKNT